MEVKVRVLDKRLLLRVVNADTGETLGYDQNFIFLLLFRTPSRGVIHKRETGEIS